MRYLGIDYGLRRVGIALSDPEGKIALPQTTLEPKNPEGLLKEVCALVQKENIGGAVIGLPHEFEGFDAAFRKRVLDFGRRLEKISGLQVAFEDELFSTRIARRTSPRKADAAAAALILQSFLDRQNALG